MDTILSKYVAAFKASLATQHIEYRNEKAINYGWQIECVHAGATVRVNFYHGKKGLSTVIQGKDSSLKQLLETLAGGAAKPASANEEIPLPPGTDTWMGCDESGKGDVFGPIVCAACMVTKETADTLRAAGVCDSKQLNDRAIIRLADVIRETVADQWVVRIVMPGEYNLLYKQFKKAHKNLNNLLGNLHAENIRVLLSKYECPCIIVDKFGKEEYVLSELGGLSKSHTIIQVTKGERDTAVAAASILAREAFVTSMSTLAAHYDLEFPKGAYMGIEDTIHKVIDRYGAPALAEVGKLNFKNFDAYTGSKNE